jgi:hypothetical protein
MWLFLEDDKKPKAFISCSLRKEDQKYVSMIISIVKLMGFIPVGTVGKYSASPKPIWQQMNNGIKSADCIVLIATPRYLQRDIHDRKKTGRGISEMLHMEVGMAITADRPVLAFVQKGTNVGAMIPQITQYIELAFDEMDVNEKWPLIKSYFKNAMTIIERKWDNEDNREMLQLGGAILAGIGAAKLISEIFGKRIEAKPHDPDAIHKEVRE